VSADQIAIVLILIAAFLHALANTLVKVSDDALLTRGFMSAVSATVMVPVFLSILSPRKAACTILLVSVPMHA
jgi:hypothetical protein